MKFGSAIFLSAWIALAFLMPSNLMAREDAHPEWAMPVSKYVLETLRERGPYFTLSKQGKITKLGPASKIIESEDGSCLLIFRRKEDGKIFQFNSDDLFVSKKLLREIEEYRRSIEIYYG